VSVIIYERKKSFKIISARYLPLWEIEIILIAISNFYKIHQMRSAFKKLATLNKTTLFRSIGLSFIFIVFYIVILYILINSPA